MKRTDILIVEDDREQRGLLRDALETCGWDVRDASCVEDGWASARWSPPRLIITDVSLPDATGFEFCSRIRGHHELKDVPILMISGTYNKEEDSIRASGLGADAYLIKPFHIAELLNTVRRLTGEDHAAADV